jgi:hypothetical protein
LEEKEYLVSAGTIDVERRQLSPILCYYVAAFRRTAIGDICDDSMEFMARKEYSIMGTAERNNIIGL